MFSADPALSIKSRVASNIFCRIGALAEQAMKAKYLKMILNSSIVFALEIVDVSDSFLCLTNASNLLVSWLKSAKTELKSELAGLDHVVFFGQQISYFCLDHT